MVKINSHSPVSENYARLIPKVGYWCQPIYQEQPGETLNAPWADHDMTGTRLRQLGFGEFLPSLLL